MVNLVPKCTPKIVKLEILALEKIFFACRLGMNMKDMSKHECNVILGTSLRIARNQPAWPGITQNGLESARIDEEDPFGCGPPE